jgi:tetratricopeptide (TPR) repeat protein
MRGPGDSAARAWPLPVAVGLTALALRALYLWQIRSAPFFEIRYGDALSYHLWARRIASGDWVGHDAFYQAPLYPYVLAVFYRLFGDGMVGVRILNVTLGSLACVLMAVAGQRLFGRRAAWIAGLGLALWPAAIFFDGLMDKTALGTFLVTAWIAGLAAQADTPRGRRWAGSGALLGLLALNRENALVLTGAAAYWITVHPTLGHARQRLTAAALFTAGVLAILAPVAARNYAAGGSALPTTSQLGPNFYIGNGPGAQGAYQPLVVGHGTAMHEREDATRVAEEEEHRALTPAEVSRFWLGKAWTYIRSRPGEWLLFLARKLALTVNAAELPDTDDQSVYADWSALLRVLRILDFGVLVPLASMAAVILFPRWRRVSWLYVSAAVYAVSVALFYVFARYRFPLAPFLLLASAGGVSDAAARRPREGGLVVRMAAAGLVAAVIANLPLYRPRHERALANLYVNLGSAELQSSLAANEPAEGERLARASTFYERAVSIERLPEALVGIGLVRARQGRDADAMAALGEAVERRPDYLDARRVLADRLALGGRVAEAVAEYEAVLAARPRDVESHLALGELLLRVGRPGEALPHFQSIEVMHGDETRAVLGIAASLETMGRPSDALAAYERALGLDERNAAAHQAYGRLLAAQDRQSEALYHLRRAAELGAARTRK